jgi:hypothetical protein
MPCAVSTATLEGGAVFNSGTGLYNVNGPTKAALASPNCAALNSGDKVGTLVSSGTTAGYNAGAGFDLATGLGSLNIANVVNAWTSQIGTMPSTVTVAPQPNSITPDTPLQVNISVAGASGTPTGNVSLSSGSYLTSGTLSNGSASITIPGNSLTGTGNQFIAKLTASYGGDPTYAQSSGSANVTVTKRIPTVTVVPATLSTNSNLPLNVTVNVSGAGTIPTGTVTLSASGTTFSSGKNLSNGTIAFTIPANTFTASGNVTISASYSGDITYTPATGSATVAVTSVPVLTPTITVTPTPASIATGQTLNATVSVSGSGVTPTGIVTLSATGTSSTANATLSNGSAAFTIPPNTLSAGNVTVTVSYSGDSNYSSGVKTFAVTVTQSTFLLSATTPSSVKQGSPATSTITGSTPTPNTFYTGNVTLSSCTITSAPNNASFLPGCGVSGSISFNNGTPTGSATAMVTTTASAELVYPRFGNGRGLLGFSGGSVLAFLVILGISARDRRRWRTIIGMLMLLVTLSTLSACVAKTSSSSSGTTTGTYTFTVTGTGDDPAATKASTTFTVTVN